MPSHWSSGVDEGSSTRRRMEASSIVGANSDNNIISDNLIKILEEMKSHNGQIESLQTTVEDLRDLVNTLTNKVNNLESIIIQKDKEIKEKDSQIHSLLQQNEECKRDNFENKLELHKDEYYQNANFVKLYCNSSSSEINQIKSESLDINSDTNIFKKYPNRESAHMLISSL